MAPPLHPWEGINLQNSSQLVRNANVGPNVPNVGSMSVPVLPPRPRNPPFIANSYNSYMPCSGNKFLLKVNCMKYKHLRHIK